jgi:hypothetical protein
MAIYIELGALLVACLLLILIIRILREPMLILANSVIGILAFFILNAYFHLGIAINFWSVVAVALGGVAGFLLVLLLHFLGIAF